jgi:hypothetical protein
MVILSHMTILIMAIVSVFFCSTIARKTSCFEPMLQMTWSTLFRFVSAPYPYILPCRVELYTVLLTYSASSDFGNVSNKESINVLCREKKRSSRRKKRLYGIVSEANHAYWCHREKARVHHRPLISLVVAIMIVYGPGKIQKCMFKIGNELRHTYPFQSSSYNRVVC